jgi:hypothetical protein
MSKNGLAVHKDNVQVITVLIGVLTVLLYIYGYVSERVHWNLYGHIEIPANHIQFLYRGGNIIISSLASFPLYLILSPLDAALVFLTIFLLTVAYFYDRLPQRVRFAARCRSPRPLWVGCFALLILLLLYELPSVPYVPRNILFETSGVDTSQWGDYFRGYVSVTVLWLAFFIASRRKRRQQEKSEEQPDMGGAAEGHESGFAQVNHKSEGWTLFFVGERVWGVGRGRAEGEAKAAEEAAANANAPATAPNKHMLTASLVIAVALIAFLPIVYGTFQFPNVYPIVGVGLAKDASADTGARVGTAPKALLFETADDYVLYCRHAPPGVLKLRRSQVSVITILREGDVTKPESFVANTPCVERQSP